MFNSFVYEDSTIRSSCMNSPVCILSQKTYNASPVCYFSHVETMWLGSKEAKKPQKTGKVKKFVSASVLQRLTEKEQEGTERLMMVKNSNCSRGLWYRPMQCVRQHGSSHSGKIQVAQVYLESQYAAIFPMKICFLKTASKFNWSDSATFVHLLFPFSSSYRLLWSTFAV